MKREDVMREKMFALSRFTSSRFMFFISHLLDQQCLGYNRPTIAQVAELADALL